jgi:hypothetical protein
MSSKQTLAGRYLRSRTGRYARVRRARVSGRVRNRLKDGAPLYTLEHLTPWGSLKSGQLWTEDDLEAAGVRWLKHRPRATAIAAV